MDFKKGDIIKITYLHDFKESSIGVEGTIKKIVEKEKTRNNIFIKLEKEIETNPGDESLSELWVNEKEIEKINKRLSIIRNNYTV